MANPKPHTVTATSLSAAWADVFLAAHRSGAHELAPLTLRVEFPADGAQEDAALLAALDRYLASCGMDSIKTVADTIFPERQWNASKGDRNLFFQRYRKVYARLKALDVRNRNGTYFGRLIEESDSCPGGQLERLVYLYRRHPGLVKMRLQASIFNPALDHNRGARPGFPCLQHVSLAPYDQQLSLNAFYASQQLVSKACGNYFGLAALGRFLAGEMGISFAALNVFVGMAKLGKICRGAEYDALVNEAERVATGAAGAAP